jgi:hypothetical protein
MMMSERVKERKDYLTSLLLLTDSKEEEEEEPLKILGKIFLVG